MNDFSFLGALEAPKWSIAMGDTGRVLVWSGALLFALCAMGWVLAPNNPKVAKAVGWGYGLGNLTLFATFGILATLFANNRFEYEYVWGHGDSKNTLPYQIAGVWAGQEGSFLLWAVCAGLFCWLALKGTGVYRRWFGFATSVFLGVLCGILAYESPFVLNPVMPSEGTGLSPALQNYWMIIHPPVIFLGFGALTVPAAFALAAMLTKNYQDWVPIVRPWTMIAMTFTGLGLALGGFWAYETLGWGGFWMWDPVENTSFVPWVFTAALTHGLIVQATKKKWVASNLLMAGLPFIAFVYGTFLTRSGLLSETSVHSFAEMDNSALKLLIGFFGGSAILFIGLWIVRALEITKSAEDKAEKGFNREGFFRWGALLLIGLGIATAIGMSIPMIMSVTGRPQKVVEEALYHRVLTWLFVPAMFVMAAGPLASWRNIGAKELSKRLYGVLCLTLVLVGLTMVFIAQAGWVPAADSKVPLVGGVQVPTMPWILGLVTVCYFAVVANLWRSVELFRGSKLGLSGFLAHIGVAMLMLGLIVSRGLEKKTQFVVQEGGHNVGLGWFVAFKGMTKDLSDRDNQVLFDVEGKGEKFQASPGFYYNENPDGTQSPMSWPHVQRHPLYDIYFTLHPRQTDAGDPITLKPGQSGQLSTFNVKYVKSTNSGSHGTPGSKFGALLEISTGHATKTIEPMIEMDGDHVHPIDAKLGEDFLISLKSLDAGTQEATIQAVYSKPIYPVEMYFKPLTIFVWLGTFLLTLAGLMGAAYRWPRRPKTPTPTEPPTTEKKPTAERELVGAR